MKLMRSGKRVDLCLLTVLRHGLAPWQAVFARMRDLDEACAVCFRRTISIQRKPDEDMGTNRPEKKLTRHKPIPQLIPLRPGIFVLGREPKRDRLGRD